MPESIQRMVISKKKNRIVEDILRFKEELSQRIFQRLFFKNKKSSQQLTKETKLKKKATSDLTCDLERWLNDMATVIIHESTSVDIRRQTHLSNVHDTSVFSFLNDQGSKKQYYSFFKDHGNTECCYKEMQRSQKNVDFPQDLSCGTCKKNKIQTI